MTAEPTSPKVLKKLQILDDLQCLIRGNFDLSSVSALTCDKPRTKTRKYVNIQQKKSSTSTLLHSSHTPTVNASSEAIDSIVNNAAVQPNVPDKAAPCNGQSDKATASSHKTTKDSKASAIIKVKGEEYTEAKKKQDELEIKDLLDNIKESFESEFEMDLDQFSEQEDQFDSQVGTNFVLVVKESLTSVKT